MKICFCSALNIPKTELSISRRCFDVKWMKSTSFNVLFHTKLPRKWHNKIAWGHLPSIFKPHSTLVANHLSRRRSSTNGTFLRENFTLVDYPAGMARESIEEGVHAVLQCIIFESLDNNRPRGYVLRRFWHTHPSSSMGLETTFLLYILA